MAKGVPGRAGAALHCLRAGAGPRIGAVSHDLIVACDFQVASLLSFSWRGLDYFKLGILDLLHGPSQRFGEDHPTPVDLAQAGVATTFGDGS